MLGLVLVFACEDAPREIGEDQVADAFVEGLCEPMFSCDCRDQTFYPSLSECRRQAEQGFARLREEARGLTYDPSCYGSRLDAIGGPQCAPPRTGDECEAPCSPYHGARSEGASCEAGYGGSSECARGLTCSGGVCTDPCGLGERGEPCSARGCADGLWCDFSESPPLCRAAAAAGESCMGRPCDEATYCDFTDTRCRPLPDEGESCVGAPACREGTYCDTFDPEPICRALGQPGEPCRGHVQCAIDYYCPAGFCAAIPGEGESCAGASVCSAGLTCHQDVCVRQRPAVCSSPLPWPSAP